MLHIKANGTTYFPVRRQRISISVSWFIEQQVVYENRLKL